MNLLMRFRIWLSGVTYPGDRRDRCGYIGFKNGEFMFAYIVFDGVSTHMFDHGIVISKPDVDLSPHESLMLLANEMSDGVLDLVRSDDKVVF